MAAGTPVVSTDYSDIRRILPEPWQVVASREPGQIAAAILRADEERASLATAQRSWVERHATISHAADSLEAVYRKCIVAKDEAAGVSPI